MTKFEALHRKMYTANHRRDALVAKARELMGMDKPPVATFAVILPPVAAKPAFTKKKQRRKYEALVRKLTEQQDLSIVPDIHLREFRKYDLDHIISIWDGFNRGLPAIAIASVSNLRIIPHRENSDKGNKSDYAAHPLAGLLIPLAA